METTENYSRLTYEHFEAKFINIGGLPGEIHAPIHILRARQLKRSGESFISPKCCKNFFCKLKKIFYMFLIVKKNGEKMYKSAFLEIDNTEFSITLGISYIMIKSHNL